MVGGIGQGKASKARIEPTDRITHRMRGLDTSTQVNDQTRKLTTPANLLN